MRWRNTMAGIALVFVAITVSADTVYVTNRLQLGLHADKTDTSPIILLLDSGTALELIKTEGNLSYVHTADGIDGWVDSSYLLQENPATAVPSGDVPKPLVIESSGADQTTLEQQLKTERVKTGELQVQIAELRGKLTDQGQDGVSLAQVQSDLLVAQADAQTRQLLLAQSLQAMETARVEANRQTRYLSVAVAPVAPDEAAYPRAFENTLVVMLIFAGIYLMVSMTVAILREQVSA